MKVADLVALAADELRKRSSTEMRDWASRVSLSRSPGFAYAGLGSGYYHALASKREG
jgi:hypothetical protein